jgi:leucyl aminopeptidase
VINITCGYGCSDHASWNAKGYPATMPFEAPMNSSNPQIHTTGDTLTYMGGTATNSVKFAKLGVAFMGEVAKGATSGNTPPPVNDGTTPPPTGNALTNGVATAAYSGSTGTWKCWTLSVPTGKTSVVFNQTGLSGTTGDADLYVRYNAAPTSSSYNCRPYISGNTETCTINSPTAGTWYACSYAYSAYSNVTMKGTY